MKKKTKKLKKRQLTFSEEFRFVLVFGVFNLFLQLLFLIIELFLKHLFLFVKQFVQLFPLQTIPSKKKKTYINKSITINLIYPYDSSIYNI